MTTEEIAAIESLWDYETAIEDAVAEVFTRNGMEANTPSHPNEFQSKRPRVDVVFKVGGAAPQGHRTISNDGFLITDAYRGTLGAVIVTGSDDTGKSVHTQYRALIRWIMAQLPTLVNGTLLTLHKIHFVTESGTSLVKKQEDGYWTSGIEIAIDFSPQPDALKALTLPTTDPLPE